MISLHLKRDTHHVFIGWSCSSFACILFFSNCQAWATFCRVLVLDSGKEEIGDCTFAVVLNGKELIDLPSLHMQLPQKGWLHFKEFVGSTHKFQYPIISHEWEYLIIIIFFCYIWAIFWQRQYVSLHHICHNDPDNLFSLSWNSRLNSDWFHCRLAAWLVSVYFCSMPELPVLLALFWFWKVLLNFHLFKTHYHMRWECSHFKSNLSELICSPSMPWCLRKSHLILVNLGIQLAFWLDVLVLCSCHIWYSVWGQFFIQFILAFRVVTLILHSLSNFSEIWALCSVVAPTSTDPSLNVCEISIFFFMIPKCRP